MKHEFFYSDLGEDHDIKLELSHRHILSFYYKCDNFVCFRLRHFGMTDREFVFHQNMPGDSLEARI